MNDALIQAAQKAVLADREYEDARQRWDSAIANDPLEMDEAAFLQIANRFEIALKAKLSAITALESALSSHPQADCTCPSGDGSLRWPCPVHPPVAQAEHLDDAAVDAFAAAMKAKLAIARAKGRGGWQDKTDCPQQRLSDMLRDHVAKGDPRDVANFCCFLWNRGEGIAQAEQPGDFVRVAEKADVRTSRQVDGVLMHWCGIPVAVTGQAKTHPNNWPLIDESLTALTAAQRAKEG